MKTQPQQGMKKAAPMLNIAQANKKKSAQFPRVTPNKGKGTLKGLPIVQYIKSGGKKTQVTP